MRRWNIPLSIKPCDVQPCGLDLAGEEARSPCTHDIFHNSQDPRKYSPVYWRPVLVRDQIYSELAEDLSVEGERICGRGLGANGLCLLRNGGLECGS